MLAGACADNKNNGTKDEMVRAEPTGGDTMVAAINQWAMPLEGKLTFSADVQNLVARRHHALSAQVTGKDKRQTPPLVYRIKANDLAKLQAALEQTAATNAWTRVVQPELPPRNDLDDPLAGSWGQLWRKPAGGYVIIAGQDAVRPNPAGDLLLIVDTVE